MEILQTVRSLPRIQKVILGIGVALLLYTLVGFFAVPPILKYILTNKLAETVHREVGIDKVRVNPYVLSARINGFTVKNRDVPEPFLSIDELYGNFQILSLFKWGVIFKEIRLETPRVWVNRNVDGGYNFSDLIEEFASKTESSPEGAKESPAQVPGFSLNNIQIHNGTIEFFDGPKGIRHVVRELNLNIPFLSSFPYYVDTYVQPVLEANVNGTPVTFRGKTKPFKDSLETSFDLDIRKFNIPFYLAYVPLKYNFKLVTTYVDSKGVITFRQYRGRPPSLGFAGKIALDTIDVEDSAGNRFLRLPLLDLSIASSDLFSRKIRFSSILVQSPEIGLRRDKNGRINLPSLSPDRRAWKTVVKSEEREGEKAKEMGREKEKASGFSIEADTIRVTGGNVDFHDLSGAKPFRTTFSPVNIEINHFSNADREKSGYVLSLATESQENLEVSGDFTVIPFSSDGSLTIGKVRPGKYSPYFGGKVLFDVEDGFLDLSTRYRIARTGSERETNLSGLYLALRSLRLRKRGEEKDFLAVPAADVKNAEMDLERKKLVLREVSTRKGIIEVNRPEDGEWNLATLLPEGPPEEEDALRGEEEKDETPWQVVIGKVRLDGYTVKVEDASASEPVSLTADRIAFRGSNLSTEKGKSGRASISFTLNENGSVAMEGDVGIDPAFARMKIAGKALDLVPLQPYFSEKVKIVVTSGAVSGDGTLSVASSRETGQETTYAGGASLRRFASVDRETMNDFLKFSSLDLIGMDVRYAASGSHVHVDEIGLTDFFSRIIVNPDATLNVQGIVVENEKEGKKTEKGQPPASDKEESAVSESSSGSPTEVKIERVTLQGGTINFTDRNIQPAFSANLTEVGGRVSGLASGEGKKADVDLRGTLENYAPLTITGSINPFREMFLVDLQANFQDMDISSLTPYSGRYMGYTIQKGKLSLDLQYLIVKRKLESENRVFLDQLTLGDPVESPEATKLPVKLAIALLKNRKGEIKLDLPVTGNVDDPQFSVGGVILKILKNILVKAATSPFALLGAISGGGEEISFLEFEYGSATIPPTGEKKLSQLSKILYERPALKVEIEGHADIEQDKEELRNIFFHRKMKAQKLKDIVRKGNTAITVDEVVIGPEEYPKYLKRAYKREKFPKPRNFLGIAKSLPVPEMEKLMFTHIEVTTDDLRLLALQRAQSVQDYLLKTGKVEANRLFLIEPDTLQPGKKEKGKGKDSRVNFRIK
jgi:uncharacterized protein involved in outer membrane biogenesis